MSLLVFNFTCWVMIFSMLSRIIYTCFGNRWPWSWEHDNDLDRKVNISVLLAWCFHFQCTLTPDHIFHSHEDVFLNMPTSLIKSFFLFSEQKTWLTLFLFYFFFTFSFNSPYLIVNHLFLLNLLFCMELLSDNYVIYAHIFNLR